MERIVIVGATSGIGRALAEKFIAAGHMVGVTGRRADRLEEIRSLAPDRVYISCFDVTESGKLSGYLSSLVSQMGGMDRFIYNSGIGKASEELEEDMEMATLKVNSEGFLESVCFAFGYFREKGTGHIAATASVAATRGLGMSPAYSATKAFIMKYMEALEQKSAILGVRISFTTVRPGFIDTDFISGKSYPFTMGREYAFSRIYRAICRRKRSVVVDWKWAVIVSLWKMIPPCLWVRMKVK